MKTIDILGLYKATNQSKLTKVCGKGKIKIARNINAMRAIVNTFDEFRKDALERLKPEGYDEALEQARKWQQWSENKSGDCPLSKDEVAKLNKYFLDYNNIVEECLKDEAEKEHDIDFGKLTDEEMEQFADSNDFSIEDINLIMQYML